jgi:hypothetical protein
MCNRIRDRSRPAYEIKRKRPLKSLTEFIRFGGRVLPHHLRPKELKERMVPAPPPKHFMGTMDQRSGSLG